MQMISKKILATTLAFVFVSASMFAQGGITLDTAGIKLDNGISNSTFNAVFKTVQNALSDYDKYSKIFDSSTRTMSNEAVNNFISLFDPENARLVKDYRKNNESTTYNVNDYFLDLSESDASNIGIQSTITDAQLLEMKLSEKDRTQITSKVRITKKFENYVEDGKTGYYRPSQSKQLVLSYNTATYYTEEALITSIQYYNPETQPKDQVMTKKITTPVSRCGLIDGNTSLPVSIGEDTLTLIDNLICNALDNYKAAATFIDAGTSAVTGASASKFQQLFTSGSSLHLADYREYPENIPVTEYREDVYKFFRNIGIEFELKNPKIKSITYDPDGFYYVDVSAVKIVPNYLDDETYDIKKSGRTREFPMDISYVIVKRIMDNPLIENALSNTIQKPEETRTIISFSPDINLPFLSGSPASGYENITSHTSLGGSPGLGFQIEIMSNFTAKHRAINKPLFLTLGLGVKSFYVHAELTDLKETSMDTTLDMRIGKQPVEISRLNDRLPFTALTMPIGISYRLIANESKDFQVFLGGKLVPMYLLASKGEYEAKGFYNLTYDQYGFSFYNQNYNFNLNPKDSARVLDYYNIGFLNKTNGQVSGFESAFHLGYRLETSFLAAISARFMLSGRLGYDGYFGSLINHKQPASSDPSLVETLRPQQVTITRDKNLIEEYYTSTSLSNISIGIGIAYKLK